MPAPSRAVLPLLSVAILLVSGCYQEQADESPVELERVDPVAESEAIYHSLNPPSEPPVVPEEILKADVLQLPDADRKVILDYWVERLRGLAWETAEADLIALGKDVIPHLIAVMDRTDETAARVKPAHAIDTPTDKSSYDFGEMAYFILCGMIENYSNYRGPSIPPKDMEQWEEWWDIHGPTLVIRGRGRGIVYE